MSHNVRKTILRPEELESRALLSGLAVAGAVAGEIRPFAEFNASAYFAPAVTGPTKPTQPSPSPGNGPFTPEQIGPRMPGIPQPGIPHPGINLNTAVAGTAQPLMVNAALVGSVTPPTKPTQPSPSPGNGPFTPEQIGPKMPGIPQPGFPTRV
jgi:hypothetical protein